MITYADYPIYFSDLNEKAQRELLEAVGAESPSDMNWDVDMCPLGYYPITLFQRDDEDDGEESIDENY